MIFLLVGLVALFLVKKSGGIDLTPATDKTPIPGPVVRAVSPVSTHVIHQSTGASLSQALGTANRAPGFYASGNPGTGGTTGQPSSTILFAKPKWSAPPITRTVSNPIRGNVTQHNPPAPQKAVEKTAVGYKRVSSALVNPKQATRAFAKPEWPGAFWTKRRIR